MSGNVSLQPGDWVRRRPFAGGRQDVFQITRQSDIGNWFAADEPGAHDESNLELVIRGAEPPRHVASLRVGDNVRIHVDQGKWANLSPSIPSPHIDTTVTHEGRYEAIVAYRGYAVSDPDGDWPFEFMRRPLPEESAEQVGETETFDSYHPSMLPMLGKIARLAEQRSWCGEFDSVLSEIGAPTRREIIQATRPPLYRYEVKRYEVTEFTYIVEAANLADATRQGTGPVGPNNRQALTHYMPTQTGNPLPPVITALDN